MFMLHRNGPRRFRGLRDIPQVHEVCARSEFLGHVLNLPVADVDLLGAFTTSRTP